MSAEKRKPGRPRKVNKDSIVKNGVVSHPTDSNRLVELIYDKPVNIKKICNIWKAKESEYVYFEFSSTDLTIYSHGFNEDVMCQAIFHGSSINSYYCSRPYALGINIKEIKSQIDDYDKKYVSVCIFTEHKDPNRLYIVAKDEYDIIKRIEVDAVSIDFKIFDEVIRKFRAYRDFDLEIKIPSRRFTDIITSIKKIDNMFVIMKIGADGCPMINNVKTKIHSQYLSNQTQKIHA